jgi:hypothetical protein
MVWQQTSQAPVPRRVGGGLVVAEPRLKTCAYGNPIGIGKPPDWPHFALRKRNGKQPEEGRLMKSRLFSVTQLAFGWSYWSWRLCSDQANDNVGPMTMIQFCREHDGRPHLGRIGTGKCAYHDVAGLQRPSRSCSSNRLTGAAVASARPFSDQESDHSTTRVRLRSPSCRANQGSSWPPPEGASARH